MGFPIDFTRQCVPKMEQKGERYEDIRMSMIGNSWHVGVVSWLIGQLARSLGLGGFSTVQDIINATTPGRARDFCSMLLRPPHQGRLGKADQDASVQLVRKCFGARTLWYIQALTLLQSISDCEQVCPGDCGDGETSQGGGGSAREITSIFWNLGPSTPA